MNKRLIIPLLTIAFSFFTHQVMAVVPGVDKIGKSANSFCKPTLTIPTGVPSLNQPVLHFDKIIFTVTGQLVAAETADQANLDKIPRNTELDIKVIDNPRTVADLKGKVLSFLGAVSNTDFYPAIKIINVEYAVIVCPK